MKKSINKYYQNNSLRVGILINNWYHFLNTSILSILLLLCIYIDTSTDILRIKKNE